MKKGRLYCILFFFFALLVIAVAEGCHKTKSYPLHEAARSYAGAVMQVIEGTGVDLEQRDNFGYTPLCVAARYGKFGCAAVLLRNGASPDNPALDGRTPLLMALVCDNIGVALLLLESGADPNSPGPVSALQIAFSRGHPRTVKRALIESGARINERDCNGNTVLIQLAETPHSVRDIQLLLSLAGQRIELDARNEAGESAFMVACGKDNFEEAAFLAKLGAQVDVRDSDGRTALIRAAMQAKRDAVVLLLTLGADPNVTDLYGNSAVDYAHMYPELQQLLRQSVTD